MFNKDCYYRSFRRGTLEFLYDKLAEKDNYFSKMIMSLPHPGGKLIFLFDEMCNEFFNNDKMQYLMLGR